MIDTVILSLPSNKVTMLDMASRGVSGWDLQSRTRAYEKFVRNPSTRDLESGLYFPRLTSYRRKNGKLQWETNLKIEFSVPKLLYRNNVEELTDEQFPKVIEALRDRLLRMGVAIQETDLKEAEVRVVHYSKNVQLTGGYTSQYVISELNKINLNKRFDLARAKYTNDGQSLYAYTQAHSLVIYDKIADLIRGKKRAIDKEQSPEQLSLFTPLTKRPEPIEILRFEVRLSQKRKLNAVFKKLGFAEDPTFSDAYDTNKSKTVVQHYWDTMIEGNTTLLFAHTPTAKDLIKQVLLTDRKMKVKEAIYRAGLVWSLREGNGMRELRSILAKRANDRTWYRIAKDASDTGTALTKLKPREWYEQIRKAFDDYKPFHTGELPVNKSKV